MNNRNQFPDIFIDKFFNYDEKEYTEDELKKLALADAFLAWGLVMSGFKQPEAFGYGMIKIRNILDIIPIPENLEKLYDEYQIDS